MPPNCKSIKNKCFKIKPNGVYQVYLVAYGYSQIPCVNFSKSYSPKVNNITFHILLLMVLNFSYLGKIVNVKTAFLYGGLEEKIYMECPQGMSDMGKCDCIILNKCIYSLGQTMRQYYEKTIKIKEFGIHRRQCWPMYLHQEKCKGCSMCSTICRQ